MFMCLFRPLFCKPRSNDLSCSLTIFSPLSVQVAYRRRDLGFGAALAGILSFIFYGSFVLNDPPAAALLGLVIASGFAKEVCAVHPTRHLARTDYTQIFVLKSLFLTNHCEMKSSYRDYPEGISS